MVFKAGWFLILSLTLFTNCVFIRAMMVAEEGDADVEEEEDNNGEVEGEELEEGECSV